MIHSEVRPKRTRWPRVALGVALVVLLVASVQMVWPRTGKRTVTGIFASAVGLYPGDEVQVSGVPVGTVDSIEPGPDNVKITMSVDAGLPLPAGVQAILMAPNLVSARFIQFTPAYTGGATLPDGATLRPDRTAVPIEWDEVKEQLNKLSMQLGPHAGSTRGPITALVNQAAETFDGSGDSFRQTVRQLSQTAARLADSRQDMFATVQNLQILVSSLSASTEQIVQFSTHVASVSQALADSSDHLDATLATLNTALVDVKGFLRNNNDTLIGTVQKLADFTQIFTDESRDVEQVLHVAPTGLVNFYNIYSPAQGSVAGLVSLPEFANPVEFICGGSLETGGTPEYFRRGELCKERMAPVLKRLTANYPPFLFHPINSITAYKGQIIYDTPQTQARAQTPVNKLQWQPLPGVTPPKIPEDTDLSSLLLPPPPQSPPAPAGANPLSPGHGR